MPDSPKRRKSELILTKKDFNRLVSNACTQPVSDHVCKEKSSREERRKRQEAAKALSKLLAQRKEPGAELRKRQYIQQAEQARQELEIESRIEARKNYVLDLAYKRLFEETDRVKYFKAAKNLAETLKDRDSQIEAKSKMKSIISEVDKDFVVGMVKDIEKHAEEEAEKVEKKKRDKEKNAAIWKKQREEKEKKFMEEKWNSLRDGLLVRDLTQKYEDEAKSLKEAQKNKIKGYKESLDQQQDQKLALMDVHMKLDEADEKRAELFNEAKRNMTMKHKKIKDELDDKKNQKRQYVAKNLRDELSDIKLKEEAILQKAIREADAKYRRECDVKKAEHEETLKLIQDFYEKELESKARKKIEDRLDKFREGTSTLEEDREQKRLEDNKMRLKKELANETQHVQLHQIAKRETDKAGEKLQNLKDYLNHMKSLNEEEEVFQKYAKLQIDDCQNRGVDTWAMEMAARPGIECGKGPLFKDRGHIRPRYYAALSKGVELNHMNRIQNQPDTKSRLGFTLH